MSNRIIKFRVWDKKNKKMIYGDDGDLLINCWGNVFMFDDDFETTIPIEGGDSKEDYEITEYTGIKDKNGKEVYEGDVLWWGKFDQNTGKKIVQTVSWDKIGFNIDIDMLFAEPDSFYSRKPLFEVVGNKFENPELLESEEQ